MIFFFYRNSTTIYLQNDRLYCCMIDYIHNMVSKPSSITFYVKIYRLYFQSLFVIEVLCCNVFLFIPPILFLTRFVMLLEISLPEFKELVLPLLLVLLLDKYFTLRKHPTAHLSEKSVLSITSPGKLRSVLKDKFQ